MGARRPAGTDAAARGGAGGTSAPTRPRRALLPWQALHGCRPRRPQRHAAALRRSAAKAAPRHDWWASLVAAAAAAARGPTGGWRPASSRGDPPCAAARGRPAWLETRGSGAAAAGSGQRHWRRRDRTGVRGVAARWGGRPRRRSARSSPHPPPAELPTRTPRLRARWARVAAARPTAKRRRAVSSPARGQAPAARRRVAARGHPGGRRCPCRCPSSAAGRSAAQLAAHLRLAARRHAAAWRAPSLVVAAQQAVAPTRLKVARVLPRRAPHRRWPSAPLLAASADPTDQGAGRRALWGQTPEARW